MQVLVRDDRARLPAKAGPQEVGYDLVCIQKVKHLAPIGVPLTMYDTGICVKPPEGYYVEIVPRSSIVKHGVFLANSVGIIDPTYRDTLKVVLAGSPMQCPFSVCQLVLRPMPPDAPVVKVERLDSTYRQGGFGSTGSTL